MCRTTMSCANHTEKICCFLSGISINCIDTRGWLSAPHGRRAISNLKTEALSFTVNYFVFHASFEIMPQPH